ncbi:DUF2971 domain-containing protein [Marinobacter sp. F3R08]|uniref:DUF2971 domain-containing protein n=1 Tax=Marinobacter sp. F3R08 TaxID=2841559 RepID=UPI001C080127|nr:DUF2971 domain-containing protein [Marinobacter sp. F3R08]MBU2952744.1 DUF2971 domain-containing protein [Marinobacter sp. F3R08]
MTKLMFESGKYVYHYTSGETATDWILPSLSLRMSPFTNVNDPRESKHWPFKFYARSAEESFDPELFREATRYVRDKSLVLCCSRDHPEGGDDSLRRGYARPRMWDQYGDKHKGVCLVLDEEELGRAVARMANGRQRFSGKVEYLDSSFGPMIQEADPYGLVYLEDVKQRGLSSVLEPLILRFSDSLFFTKHKDWEHESEQRWVVRTEDEREPDFVSIQGALRAVLLGADCTPETEQKVIACCQRHNIAIHRVNWNGWAVSVYGNLLEKTNKKSVSLNVTYNLRVPCSAIYFQECDEKGKPCTVSIDSSGTLKVIHESVSPKG